MAGNEMKYASKKKVKNTLKLWQLICGHLGVYPPSLFFFLYP